MSLAVSRRVERVKASATVAISALAAARRAAGEDIISLAAGEPDFETPVHVCDAAVAAIAAGKTHYTPVDGIPELKAAVAEKFRRDNQLNVEPGDIVIANGAKQLIYNAAMAVLNPGDKAVVVAPYWVSYPDIVRLTDATPTIITTRAEDSFKLQPEALDAGLDDQTRLLYLNSPGNPCGNVYSRAELTALGDVLRSFPNVTIVSDEIYEHLCWGEQASLSMASVCPDLEARTLTVNGVSKCYAMTGWRVGFATGPAWLMAEIRKLQGQQTTNACSVSQYAAVAALNGGLEEVHAMRDTYRTRARKAVTLLNAASGVRCDDVAGAFYVLADCRDLARSKGLADDVALCEELLKTAGVALVPGTAFGAPGYVRLSFACADSVFAEAVRRLSEFAAT